MSIVIPSHDAVVVREADAEVVGGGPVTGRLYADRAPPAARRPASG